MYGSITFFLLVGCVYDLAFSANFHVVDMTHAQSPSTVYWPGNPSYNFTILFRGENTESAFWYETNAFSTPEHGGTHLDAPAHFSQGGHRSQQIPMKQLIGPGVIINVKDKVAGNPDYRVEVADIQAWEFKYGAIPDGAIVIMNSGWTYKYPNKTLTFGTQTTEDSNTFHFPGWHENSTDWLIRNRKVNVIGVDTPSNDYGQSKSYMVHQIIAKANVPGVENVANLDDVPENGAMIYVAAIKLYDGSGGPARVFATYTDLINVANQYTHADSALIICLLTSLIVVV